MLYWRRISLWGITFFWNCAIKEAECPSCFAFQHSIVGSSTFFIEMWYHLPLFKQANQVWIDDCHDINQTPLIISGCCCTRNCRGWRNRLFWPTSRLRRRGFFTNCFSHLSSWHHDDQSGNFAQFRGRGSLQGLPKAPVFWIWREFQDHLFADQHAIREGRWRLLWNFRQWSIFRWAERGSGCKNSSNARIGRW